MVYYRYATKTKFIYWYRSWQLIYQNFYYWSSSKLSQHSQGSKLGNAYQFDSLGLGLTKSITMVVDHTRRA